MTLTRDILFPVVIIWEYSRAKTNAIPPTVHDPMTLTFDLNCQGHVSLPWLIMWMYLN